MLTREFVGQTFGQNWHYVRLYDEGVPFIWHYHPEFELTLSRNITGTRYLGGDVQSFQEVDFVLIAPNQAHTWHALPVAPGEGKAPQQIQVIFFTLDWLKALVGSGLPELLAFSDWVAGVRDGVVFSRACSEMAIPLFDKLHEARNIERLCIVLTIFDALLRDVDARRLGSSNKAYVRDHRVELALNYLQKEYCRAIRLEDVADAAATSSATLKRLFRERLGMSVTDVLLQLRIGHACHLLVSTNMPVRLVAEASGYVNQANFFKQFSDRRGLSPAEFRRRHHLHNRLTRAELSL